MTVKKKQFSFLQNKGSKHQILVTSHRHPLKNETSQLIIIIRFFLLPVIEDNETYPPAKNQKPQ